MAGTRGGFTIPGESGYEQLTLALANKWGADVIRDSDGTELSPQIFEAGYQIYSTLCLIREDLEWAKANPDKLQQNFLMSFPVVATAATTRIELLAGYFPEQFVLNDFDGVREFWQVFDRTTGEEVPPAQWELEPGGVVAITGTTPGHTYTVNFLVIRIWEEISMYNHTTNGWDGEHLRALEPRHPEAAEHMLNWLEQWCIDHPETDVVRLTSLFYNFAWFWGDDPQLPHIYSDWSGYDFTVNPIALREFTTKTGLKITSEDFVNAGRYTSSHNPPSAVYRAWMEFVQEFVLELGKKCVEIIHRHGKKAYVFYDDSWIGLEPNSARFNQVGFDGLIKSLFSGYEARLCAAADVPIHEVRLHPYLFPVDLEGKPTFSPGGDPAADARRYWVNLRRALVRAKIDRIGLGGYLSLVDGYPQFQDYIAQVADEHRQIVACHERGAVLVERPVVAILTSWGALRTWTTSGHLHENPELILTHVLESLAGAAFDVRFISVQEVAEAGLDPQIDVVINAGEAGTAWSGGSDWADPRAVAALTTFVSNGGGLIGVGQPGATPGGLYQFQLASVLGVDEDAGDRTRLMRRNFTVDADHPLAAMVAGAAQDLVARRGLHLVRSGVDVLAERGGVPVATATEFGQGRAVYFSDHRHSAQAARRLEEAIFWVSRARRSLVWASNPAVSVAQYEGSEQLLVLNNTTEPQTTVLQAATPQAATLAELELAPGELRVLPAL